MKDTLVKIVVQIQENVRRAFDIVYPTASRSRFRKLVNEFVQMLERPIKEIVDKSNELSIALQREVVTSRLKVVLSLPENDAAEVSYLLFMHTPLFVLIKLSRLSTRKELWVQCRWDYVQSGLGLIKA